MIYNLEERTAKFGENIITLCQSIKINDTTKTLIRQLIRSATSVGANYMEANQACSKKDFGNKIRICQKEANETKHWLRMLATAVPEQIEKYRVLWQEAHELTLIFAKISKTCTNNLKIKN